METPDEYLRQRTYNINSMSFTPDEIAREIRQHTPQFKMTYEVVEHLQSIGKFWHTFTAGEIEIVDYM